MKQHKEYKVKFWQGPRLTIYLDEDVATADEALAEALAHYGGGWPGGSQSTGNGIEYKVWVQEVE